MGCVEVVFSVGEGDVVEAGDVGGEVLGAPVEDDDGETRDGSVSGS